MAELGQQLRETREARGLSILDVARSTRIRPAYIEALEQERYADLPAPVYVRGFLRNYATFLGLDAEELVAILEQSVNGATQPRRRHGRDQIAAPVWHGPSPRAMTAAVLLIVAVGGIAYVFHQYSDFVASRSGSVFAATPSPTAQALPSPAAAIPTVTPIPTLPASPSPTAPPPTAAPVATKAPAAAPTAAPAASKASPAAPSPTPAAAPSATPTRSAPLVLSLQLLSACWLRVTVDGRAVFEGTLQPGTARSWEGSTFITVRLGNAGGVSVTFNGKPEGVLGAPGQVIERTFRVG